MAFLGSGGGNNPRYGRDAGAPPPYAAAYTAGQQAYPLQQAPWYTSMPYLSQYYLQPQNYAYSPQYTGSNLYSGNYQYYTTGTAAAGTRLPQSHPAIDPTMPAANMTNSTGGVGCEPGYNYFFAAEHTKVHVLKCGSTPPWQLPPNFAVPFHACHVPVNTTLADLLKGFGATNPVPKKNKCFEVTQGGNGRWYKGLSFNGDDAKMMSKTLQELGWDSTRTGRAGEKPVVYLYVTKG